MNSRLLRLMAGLVLVALIAGCYPTPPPTEAPAATQAPAATEAPAEAAPEAAAPAEGPVLLGFANMVEGYEFSTMTREGVQEEAAKLGWEVLALNNNFDANQALTNADAMVLKGVDVAVEFQLYEDIMPAMMDKFDEAGIPVITIDIPAPGATFVGVNNYEAGKLVGTWLGQYALDNWDGEPDLVLLLDDPTVGDLPKQRVDGIQDGILELLPDLDTDKILRQPGGGMRDKGLDITRAVLTSHPDATKILVSGIDDIGLMGGYAAAEELGRLQDVVFFGQGGEAEAIAIIRDPGSSYYGSVGYFFEDYGKKIVPTAAKLLAGEEVPEFVYVDIAVITKDNVDEIYPPEGMAEVPQDVLLGFANMVEGYEFSTMTREGVEEEAAALGWDVLLLNNNFDANLALTNADAMVLKEVDVAVEFQLYEDVMPAMMDKFNEAGIPVITIDIPASGATFVGVNNYEAGKLAGTWLGQYALDNWDGDADLVLLLDSPEAGDLAKQRVDGIQDGILEMLPDLDAEKLLRQPGGGFRDKGLDITRAVLTSHPDATRILVSGVDDISLLGGYAAAEELERTQDVVFFGQGGEAEAIPVIRDPDSSYYGSVGYFFEDYGKKIVPTAAKLLAGEQVPEFVYVDIAVITKDNVDEIYPPEE